MLIRNAADLNKSHCNRFNGMLKQLQRHSVTTGIHSKDNKRYPDSNVTTAEVGSYQEFGTSKLPPRMWLRIFKFVTKYKRELSSIVATAFNENKNANGVLTDIGGYQKERIKERILDDTVRPKSNNVTGTTLVDTGQLVKSIDYEVH